MVETRAYTQPASHEVEEPYQHRERRVILSIPTGSGKTYTASQTIHKHTKCSDPEKTHFIRRDCFEQTRRLYYSTVIE